MVIRQRKLSVEQIRKEAEENIAKLEKWFKQKPRRRICRADGWYDRLIFIRRGHVREDVEKAMNDALTAKVGVIEVKSLAVSLLMSQQYHKTPK